MIHLDVRRVLQQRQSAVLARPGSSFRAGHWTIADLSGNWNLACRLGRQKSHNVRFSSFALRAKTRPARRCTPSDAIPGPTLALHTFRPKTLVKLSNAQIQTPISCHPTKQSSHNVTRRVSTSPDRTPKLSLRAYCPRQREEMEGDSQALLHMHAAMSR